MGVKQTGKLFNNKQSEKQGGAVETAPCGHFAESWRFTLLSDKFEDQCFMCLAKNSELAERSVRQNFQRNARPVQGHGQKKNRWREFQRPSFHP